jgi:DNA-binding transcriptional LysR family regulator
MPGVVYRPFVPPAPLARLGVAWRQDADSNAVRWFLEVLDELAGAVEAGGRLEPSVAGNGRAPAGVAR